jgi:hypothetical protein
VTTDSWIIALANGLAGTSLEAAVFSHGNFSFAAPDTTSGVRSPVAIFLVNRDISICGIGVVAGLLGRDFDHIRNDGTVTEEARSWSLSELLPSKGRL